MKVFLIRNYQPMTQAFVEPTRSFPCPQRRRMKYVLCQVIPVHVLITSLFASSDLSKRKNGKPQNNSPHTYLLQYVWKQTHFAALNAIQDGKKMQFHQHSSNNRTSTARRVRLQRPTKLQLSKDLRAVWTPLKKPLYVRYRRYPSALRVTLATFVLLYFGKTQLINNKALFRSWTLQNFFRVQVGFELYM